MFFVKASRQVYCKKGASGFIVSFNAMASPCEVLIDTTDHQLARKVGQAIANEAWRIEDKYSRYDPQSICSQLNQRAGKFCEIDEETYALFAFAGQCYQMSDGLFDITSGILRKAWHFDGSNKLPSEKDIIDLLPFIGWSQVLLTNNTFTMQPHMEIDLGGLGKEYAVDRALNLAMLITDAPLLINFGGDLAVSKPRQGNTAWQVGIEHPSFANDKTVVVAIKSGAIATSGDARRFLLKDGKRYSHILNVHTGWSVENPPNSITVAAPQCIQAGFLATLALLQGVNAERLLNEQNIQHWTIR